MPVDQLQVHPEEYAHLTPPQRDLLSSNPALRFTASRSAERAEGLFHPERERSRPEREAKEDGHDDPRIEHRS